MFKIDIISWTFVRGERTVGVVTWKGTYLHTFLNHHVARVLHVVCQENVNVRVMIQRSLVLSQLFMDRHC